MPTAVLMLGLSCVVAGVVCFWFWRRMKTVRPKSKADVYVAAGGLHLTAQRDQYERTVTTRTKIQKEAPAAAAVPAAKAGAAAAAAAGNSEKARRWGVCPPFFPEGTSVMDLTLVYG